MKPITKVCLTLIVAISAGLAISITKTGWQAEKRLEQAVPVDTLAVHGIARASWYGKYFHGRTTRYGETYDMNGLTTACNYLPHNTRLLVTNTANDKSVVVRVNDTGAFRKCYLDLSRAAFQAIADTNLGVITVEIRIIATTALGAEGRKGVECNRQELKK